eukprot:scaffold2811_cov102-Cylindrotheca_fusiformis.AAC.5
MLPVVLPSKSHLIIILVLVSQLPYLSCNHNFITRKSRNLHCRSPLTKSAITSTYSATILIVSSQIIFYPASLTGFVEQHLQVFFSTSFFLICSQDLGKHTNHFFPRIELWTIVEQEVL